MRSCFLRHFSHGKSRHLPAMSSYRVLDSMSRNRLLVVSNPFLQPVAIRLKKAQVLSTQITYRSMMRSS
jgi:hypothetical protein